MLRNRTIPALAALLALTSAYAAAQMAVPSMKTSVTEGEKAVATYYTEDSVGDVQLGRLGLKKSSNSAVRALAQAMVRDHTTTAQGGMRVAQAIGDSDVKWKAGDSNQIELTRLNRYSGSEFNRQYLKTLIEAHKTDIATAQDSLEFVSNAQLKSYLHETLNVDQKHLSMAESAQSKL
jgi:putative membrane protein